jgi:nicotinamidase-related amidase
MYPNPLLLEIDTQVGMFMDENDPIYNPEEFFTNVNLILDKAHDANIPVIFIQHDGKAGGRLEFETEGWFIHPDLHRLETDLVIRKKTPSAFVGTSLESELKKRHIKTLLITGLQSECCVDSTVRHASFLGYQVVLIRDAHSTFDSPILPASQIIAQENYVLGDNFSELKSASEIDLS